MVNAKRKAWVVDVNMGYGHSRAAYSLKDLCDCKVLSANDYEGIPESDAEMWNQSRELYEKISRLKPIPVVGDLFFEALDHWQQIPDFYPSRDLSKPNMQLKQIYRLIKKGLGKHLVEMMSEDPVPLVTTFFIPAFAADYYNYPGDIYCITTDADISRAWVAMDPKQSRIKYLAANGRCVERLKLYGVPSENIILTGFPLPKEMIGGHNPKALKKLLMQRICHLDPNSIFLNRYQKTIAAELGRANCSPIDNGRTLTVSYSVGGAGAQKKLGVDLMKSLSGMIKQKRVRLILIAGVRKNVVKYYKEAAKKAGLEREIGKLLLIPEFETRAEYFDGFNELLAKTDILWTKPSELSFYTGLGLPVIIAPPIGSQEEFNQVWLQYVGGGIPQANPKYTDEWLFDWIESGGMARMAWNGYMEAPTHGTYRIENIVLGKEQTIHPLPLIV